MAAIITNIAEDAETRLEFWKIVEEEEGAPGPDRMTIASSSDPEFWALVAKDARCPVELRRALNAPDATARQKFKISSGKEVRAFLSTIPGCEGKRKKKKGESAAEYRVEGAGFAKFHDGRGGRVQYRIIGELPSELSMAGRMRALRRFAQRFEELRMPFNLAMHAPDHGNSEHQWHFHLDYYDRPSWQLTPADIEAALSKGYKPIGDGVGEWSFAAKFRRDGKNSRPFKEDKVKERRAPEWIERLRERLAFVINEELKREGQHPRYDPRSYDKMGIKAEPGEHLGTKLSAAESKGNVNEASVANETKQWAAIQRQLEDQRDAGNLRVSAATAARMRRLKAVDLSVDEASLLAGNIAELDTLERAVIDVDHETVTAQHLAARACSRASKVQQVNQRWLDADEAGECELTPRLRLERASLRTAATDYLDRLEPLRSAAADIISVCDGVRASTLAQKRSLERLIEMRLTDAETKAARMPAWLAQLDRERPLIAMTREGYRLSGLQDVERMLETNAAQLALAARYARQEREVDALILTVDTGRRDLERRAGRWLFHHVDPAVVARFGKLRDHPRVTQAIDGVMSPSGSVDAQMRRPNYHHPAGSMSASMQVSEAPMPPPRDVAAARSGGETSVPATTKAPTPHQMPVRTASAATIASSPLPPERPASASMATVPNTAPVRTPANATPLPTVVEQIGSTPLISEGDQIGKPAAPAIRDHRIDAMSLAVQSTKGDPPPVGRPASAEESPVRQTPKPTMTTNGPSNAAPILSTGPSLPTAPRVHTVQRLIDEKVVLRLDMKGEIDLRALARQGITIADADRRDRRLIGRAQEQRRRAREAVETFVTKHPGFVVKVGDVCSLSPKTKSDVRAFFDNHDGPGMQVMLRRVFDRHQATCGLRGITDAVAPVPEVATGQPAGPPSTSTLERDPAMIVAAQSRLRQIEREQAAAAARVAAARQRPADVGPGHNDGQAGPPNPPTPGPRRPPPGWDGGFGR